MTCPWISLNSPSKWGVSVRLADYQSHSLECPTCDLLIRAVEASKPGWVNKYQDPHRSIFLDKQDPGPVVIHLKEDDKKVHSFQYFRPPKGMAEIEELKEAESPFHIASSGFAYT